MKLIAWLFVLLNLFSPLIMSNDRFVPFRWKQIVTSGTVYDRGALVMPVKIKGIDRQFYAQFDTGCESTFIYGGILKQFVPDIDTTRMNLTINWYEPDSSIGIYEAPVAWSMHEDLAVDTTAGNESAVNIGVIGASALKNRILIIDYARNEFAVFGDTLEIPEELKQHISYVPAEIVKGLFMIDVVLGIDTLKRVMLDTGASELTLLLPRKMWHEVTGLTGSEPSVEVDTVTSWGNKVPLWRAPVQVNLKFGSVELEKPMVECVHWPESKGDSFFLIGNAPFFDRYVTVMDWQNARFGVIENK